MRVVIRSLVATILALLGAIVLAVSWTTATAVQLVATALIMGGTDHSLTVDGDTPEFVESYLQNAINEFINPAAAAPTGTGGDPISGVDIDTDDVYAVTYPAEFFPIFGSETFDNSVAEGFENLSGCVRADGCAYNEEVEDPPSPLNPPTAGEQFVIFGYSQSAVVASQVKQDMIDNPGESPIVASFFLLANPTRPNGGFLSRGPEGLTIPILGVTFTRGTPTNSCETGTCLPTVDAAAQYDGLGGDAAVGLTNIPAVINAALGYYYLHGNLANASFSDALYQGSYGDTDYYLYPTPRLPLLMPLDPAIPSPILTALDAPLRALIEGGYAHDVNPGIPVKVSLLPFRDPIKTLINVLVAIPTGIDDAIAEATGNPSFRPLGTQPVTSPFGVGGPDLPDPPSALHISAMAARGGDDDSTEDQSLNTTPDANASGDESGDDVAGHSGQPAAQDDESDDAAMEDARQEEEATQQQDAEDSGDSTAPANGPSAPSANTPDAPSVGQPGDAGSNGDEGDSGDKAGDADKSAA